MLLTITTTHAPATDLGYLLAKHPARPQEKALSFGVAHVFYPEASDNRCTAALFVEIDPVGLIRNRRGGPAGEGFALENYVNDRPYAASSLLSVAIAQVYGTALAGTCKTRPELASTPIPLVATIASVPIRGGATSLDDLFTPLGYRVTVDPLPLDERFPSFGGPRYATVTIAGTVRLTDLLSHLYVLLPVLDGDKHYWIGEDEVNKLLRHGEGWLAAHPAKERIVERYLMRRRHLTRLALEQLADAPADADEEKAERAEEQEASVERPIRLNAQRLDAVIERIVACGASSVLDLGCSNGNLLKRLLGEKQLSRIVGYDVSHRALEVAAERLDFERMHESKRKRIELMHGSLVYRDRRLEGFDAAAVIEVIEHLDPPRLAAFERALFEFARPATVVVTTPNVEYNVLFAGMAPGQKRHRDHRFEWTRAEFEAWSRGVAERARYAVEFAPVGPVDESRGSPTQMAVFTRAEKAGAS